MSQNIEYENKSLTMVASLLEGKKFLLHEYYVRVNKEKDKHVLGDLDVLVYTLDREEMTPHIHLKNNDEEIEVSLIDWEIINVKRPTNKKRDWSDFTSFRKRFFEWLENPENVETLFRTWNNKNPDNLVEDYSEEAEKSPHLNYYLTLNNNPIILDKFRKKIYSVLTPLFKNKESKEKLKDLDSISLLKEIGLYDEYHLEDTNEDVIRTAEDAIRDIKIWFSYV